MEERKQGLSPLAAFVILVGIACATLIGYRIAQNNRYTTFGPGVAGNMLLWDNWKNEPVFKEGEAAKQYDYWYKDKNKGKE